MRASALSSWRTSGPRLPGPHVPVGRLRAAQDEHGAPRDRHDDRALADLGPAARARGDDVAAAGPLPACLSSSVASTTGCGEP